MDAKSLLFRMLLKRILKRTVIVALLGWAAFAWATGRIAPGEGIARVYSTITDKARHKSKSGPEGQDTAAVRAAAQTRVAGIDPAAKPAAGAQPKGAYGVNDVLCLAHAIYYEARGEPRDTQIGVAQVALNRVTSMPGQKSICRIVYLGLGRPMGCLFAQTCRHLGTIPDDETRWRSSVELAQDVAAGTTSLPIYAQATHFNSSSLRPSWVSSVYKLQRVGRFTFYSSQPVDVAEGAPTATAGKPRTERGQKSAALSGEESAASAAAAAVAARRKAANLPRAASSGAAARAERPDTPSRPERSEPPARSKAEPARSPFGDTFN